MKVVNITGPLVVTDGQLEEQFDTGDRPIESIVAIVENAATVSELLPPEERFRFGCDAIRAALAAEPWLVIDGRSLLAKYDKFVEGWSAERVAVGVSAIRLLMAREVARSECAPWFWPADEVRWTFLRRVVAAFSPHDPKGR